MNVLETPRIVTLQKILKNLDHSKIDRVLDIGCGNGFITKNVFMKYFNADFYGIDIEGIEDAKNNGIKSFKWDLNKQNKFIFADNFFDLIFAGEIIEHLLNPDPFLSEVYRTLNKRGIFIITTPNLSSWLNRIVLLMGFQPFWTDCSHEYPFVGKMVKVKKEGKGRHLRVFTFKALVELLQIHGFDVLIKKGTFFDDITAFPLLFQLIEKVSWNLPSFSSSLIIVCKKRN